MAKRFLSFALCFCLISSFFVGTTVFAESTYPRRAEINSSNGSTKIYSLAGTTGHEANPENKNKSQPLCDLTNGTKIILLAEELDGDGDLWYKIAYGEDFSSTGYAFSSRVRIIYDYVFDSDFEKNLENFPESYRDYLRSLHAKYPNWQFIAHDVELSFEDAVYAQYGVDDVKNTRKWVEFTYGGAEWRDARGYNEQNDSWITLETRWTYASKMAIEYFLDPRNSLDENKIFVFMQQSYNKDLFSKDALRTVVKDTFLEKGYDKTGDSAIENDAYIDDIIAAAEQSGVSPYVIAATIIIEQGTKGDTDMISGRYPGFEGYYNFFNFSASGNTKDAITKAGLTYAKQNGWNNREAAIIGGAQKYADGYIGIGQDTYYYKDFNVVNKVWWHQYAAAVYDAWTNANYLKKGCTVNTDASLTFLIPVYYDMPQNPAPVPTLTPEVPDLPEPENPEPPTTESFGDVNDDKHVNNKDLAVLMQYINGWDVTINTTIADINADGKTNNKDYALLMQYINGWDIKQNNTTNKELDF